MCWMHFKFNFSKEKAFLKLLTSETYCRLQWTVRSNSLASILCNFETFQSTWDEAIRVAHDTETKARIQGMAI